jgi:SAM-dependent methyltransferase
MSRENTMARAKGLLLGVASVATAALAVLVVRHRPFEMGRAVPGGILVGDARIYDAMSHRLLLGSLFPGVADDVRKGAPDGSRVLEVGCGPGHLSILLSRRYGLNVTGVDLDPAMIERARTNSERSLGRDGGPSFLVGDVASLPFPGGSFDLVVSTLSLHHWVDAGAGLAEIRRVLRPNGRVLVWDFGSGFIPLHGRRPKSRPSSTMSGLEVVDVTPWRWPWRLTLLERIELVPMERSNTA